jgi:hypothetical protein
MRREESLFGLSYNPSSQFPFSLFPFPTHISTDLLLRVLYSLGYTATIKFHRATQLSTRQRAARTMPLARKPDNLSTKWFSLPRDR